MLSYYRLSRSSRATSLNIIANPTSYVSSGLACDSDLVRGLPVVGGDRGLTQGSDKVGFKVSNALLELFNLLPAVQRSIVVFAVSREAMSACTLHWKRYACRKERRLKAYR